MWNGLPEIDEAAMMQEVIPALQSVVNVPLQIDSSSVAAIERKGADLQWPALD